MRQKVATKGENSRGIYFILSGVVEGSHSKQDEVPILSYTTGSFFGENCFLNEPFERDFK